MKFCSKLSSEKVLGLWFTDPKETREIMDDLEFLLDNQLEFNLPVEDGTVVFDGSVMQAVGSRVVVAIPENELVSQPEGMNLSPGGFY